LVVRPRFFGWCGQVIATGTTAERDAAW
jgi:hypothetical protein